MRILAHVSMVMNLDKCIGCHTCSITCKNTWTNRPGAEYMWWNNVETRPGVGYPKRWEDQDRYRGGWVLDRGKLKLRIGGKVSRLLRIFYNPYLPTIDDYYEPWTYDYEKLITASDDEQPIAKPKSLITGDYMAVQWGPNWDDDLAGSPDLALMDPNLSGIEEEIKIEFERVFMFYLPRICNHCLNPPCVAACPSGAIYKREEDGIVLVDQGRCRGWRFCVSACPYKKVYFNWRTHKAEKCVFCYPRIENGLPTVCAETCVGRIRYIGILLYDADSVLKAASEPDPKKLVDAQLSVIADPWDPEVINNARENGVWDDWIEAAQRSPTYKFVKKWRIAFPLHPEYRTLPMVFYIPPLSPVLRLFNGEDIGELAPEDVFPRIDKLRIPIKYLASMFTAGNEELVRMALKKLMAVRIYMRSLELGSPNEDALKEVGLTSKDALEMHKLLAIAKYEDRFVIPKSHRESMVNPYTEQGMCGYEQFREAVPETRQSVASNGRIKIRIRRDDFK
ncbi:nitrate reductase subunit beta [Vulcanisaeta thermophila]|uniref:nitrate reductase subunit beta n=1 Tax=Vulcanisaeta thermophila TaxID=867917 RepID=UPI000852AE0D|nr:nitrate reductase subunit beta [Vulcanisaeta thermophila]